MRRKEAGGLWWLGGLKSKKMSSEKLRNKQEIEG